MATRSSIINRIYERQVMLKFASVLEQQFKENLRKTKTGESGKLEKSFRTKVHIGTDRRVSKISFTHLDYGVFVDMGVGNGVNLSDIGMQKIGRTLLGRKIGERRAKRWYYKKIHGQTIRFATIIMTMRGLEFKVALESAIDQIADVRIDI